MMKGIKFQFQNVVLLDTGRNYFSRSTTKLVLIIFEQLYNNFPYLKAFFKITASSNVYKTEIINTPCPSLVDKANL